MKKDTHQRKMTVCMAKPISTLADLKGERRMTREKTKELIDAFKKLRFKINGGFIDTGKYRPTLTADDLFIMTDVCNALEYYLERGDRRTNYEKLKEWSIDDWVDSGILSCWQCVHENEMCFDDSNCDEGIRKWLESKFKDESEVEEMPDTEKKISMLDERLKAIEERLKGAEQ